MRRFLRYLGYGLVAICCLFAGALAMYGARVLSEQYWDMGKSTAQQCTEVPNTAFYRDLRTKTMGNYNKRIAKYTDKQRLQLLENARQTLAVSQTIIAAACAKK